MVVFQAIEIERLSVEIESLRVRLADGERQVFNHQSYEVQIRELTERCFELEGRKAGLEQEIVGLRLNSRQAQLQVDDYRAKVSALEDALREQEEGTFTLREQLMVERKQREQSEEGRLMLESSIQ